jgi:acetyl esterase
MLTEQERALIKRWNDFAASPRSDIKAFRDSLDKICAELGIISNLPEIGDLHENVEMRPGLAADIAAPKGEGPHPVVVMLHGGGWAAGSLRTHRKLAMHFAANGYLTINVDYRLAPENPFPAGFDDCVFAAHWASENVHKWDGDPSRMALAGDSAGANLAAATLLALSSDPNAPIFRTAVLIYGVFDFPSIIERAPSRAAVEGMARSYLGSN